MRLNAFAKLAFGLALPSLTSAQTLSELLKSHANLSAFQDLLFTYGDIYANLTFDQGVTIFAPSNAAFDRVQYTVLAPAFNSNNSDALRELLFYHSFPSSYPSTAFTDHFQFWPTFLTNETQTNVSGGAVVATVRQGANAHIAVSGLGSRSTLTTTDLKFDNGLLHILDTFLIPPQPFSASAPSFNLTSFPGALDTNASLSSLVDTMSNLTIFAPNDQALSSVFSSVTTLSAGDLAHLLDYHIVELPPNITGPGYTTAHLPNGNMFPNDTFSTTLTTLAGLPLNVSFAQNTLFVNNARVLQTDLLLSNGILHIIDAALDPNATAAQPQPSNAAPVNALPGSGATDGAVPFTTFLPTATPVLFAYVSPTANANSTDAGSAATSTASSSGLTSTSKAAADGVRVVGGGVAGALLGAVIWIVGFL